MTSLPRLRSVAIANVLATALLAATFTPAIAAAADLTLAQAAAAPERTPSAVARDSARHPVAELEFFGVKPDMTVLEIWPAPGYWSEILGPYLAAHGHYIVAHPPRGDAEGEEGHKAWADRIAKHKGRMGTITETTLGTGKYDIAPAGSVDMVVTFRNLHNWMGAGDADKVIAAFYKALKPGGILGIEDHRGRNDKPQDPKAQSGYVREDYAIELIKRAGFEFVGKSEINANPKDTKEWPEGVWTLPPTFALGAKDHDKYAAIGEGDNFVLKFRKPAAK